MAAKKVLPEKKFDTIEIRKSASQARRELLMRDYDVVLINAPLQDGMGTDFVMDIVEKSSAGVIFAVPNEIYGNVNDHFIEYGVLTVPKPVKKDELERMIKLLTAMNDRLRKTQKKLRVLTEKMDELKVMSRAKLMLVEKGMTEAEAHEYILREAMNRGLTKKQVAQNIIDD